MVSKMQLHSVGEICPGYLMADNASWMPTIEDLEKDVSCETCIHWEDNKCNINLFDKVLTSLDQT
ncbi:MAG: hypothetical protein PHE70_02870 [Tepidanaerobacteraceae bacterium]|nr:hypothetical protein [Tepidanaerobacteraceae bacterium]